ncbi:MAG: hypothetical protein ABIJ37_06320 [Pseudomonadota bacterium]
MRHTNSEIIPIGLFTLYFLLFSVCEAQAYLDPGTGSYILQLILAGLFGTLVTIKIYWKRIKTYLKSSFSGKKHENGKG